MKVNCNNCDFRPSYGRPSDCASCSRDLEYEVRTAYLDAMIEWENTLLDEWLRYSGMWGENFENFSGDLMD